MDDTISRQSAIEVIDAAFPVDPMKSEYTQGIACGVALAKTYVEQLPSAQPYTEAEIEKMQELEQAELQTAYEIGKQDAQPERKRGKWKRRLVDGGFNADWHCSECGWRTSLEEHGYNFCPNCGADMRGEQDETN